MSWRLWSQGCEWTREMQRALVRRVGRVNTRPDISALFLASRVQVLGCRLRVGGEPGLRRVSRLEGEMEAESFCKAGAEAMEEKEGRRQKRKEWPRRRSQRVKFSPKNCRVRAIGENDLEHSR